MNWRGRPLVSDEVIVELIAATTTNPGLKVRAELDQGSYRWASRAPTASWPPCRHGLAWEWNYTVLPTAA
jgi:hypothetical protein